jgi:hypothetical protein
MATHVRCGTLFTGNEDAERRNQTLVIESGRITYVGPTDKAPKADNVGASRRHSGTCRTFPRRALPSPDRRSAVAHEAASWVLSA